MSQASSPSIDSDPGKPLIPEYELIRIIGQGAYGDVWIARGITGVYRAIKIVWRSRFEDAEPFDREFRGLTEFAAVSLAESRQLALLHVGRNEAMGFFYYVMELADDVKTGREILPETYVPLTLRELRQRQGRLPIHECVKLGIGLAEGLAFLHSCHLVHRDIKPSNVILVGGEPKLADIGLVSAADEARTFVGTEGFIPPEGPGTPASDVYSLGKVFYELSTGHDRKRFPTLPDDFAQMSNRQDFFRFNELVIRACEGEARMRYANAGELLADLRALEKGRPLRRRTTTLGRRIGLVVITLVLFAGIVAALVPHRYWQLAVQGRGAHFEVAQPSVAVLPFENLSSDPSNAFFVDGLHQDIITSLAKIHGLRVISRPSVVSYRGSRELRKIAKDLEVTNILEGDVRREGNKVQFAARLVNGETEQQIWADSFEENVADMFVIQRKLAERIAAALQTKLSADETRLIARRLTQSPEAWDLYVQARTRDESLGNSATLEEYRPVISLYEQALTKDPTFALAYAQLAQVHLKLYWFPRFDATPERVALARTAAREAQRLAPNEPETKLVLGKLAYNDALDWELALSEYHQAEKGMPNDDQLVFAIGITLRRLGQWEEALKYLNRASVLNPRWLSVSLSVTETFPLLRRFSEAETAARNSLRRFPNNRRLLEFLRNIQYEIDGDRPGFLTSRYRLPPPPTESLRLVDRYQAALERGDLSAAEAVLMDPRLGSEMPDELGALNDPVVLERARLAFIKGDHVAARKFGEQALAFYRTGSWIPRQKHWIAMREAEALAFAGRAREASAAAELGWTMIAERDAIDAALLQPSYGRVQIILGRADDALKVLERIAAAPCPFGPQRLRHDPFWSRLSGHDRFERALHAMKPI